MLWDEAVQGYWLHRRRELSPNTVADYSNTFRQFGDFVGDREVESIATDDCNAFLNELADRGMATKTISNAWTALSSFWTWAEDALGLAHPLRGRISPPSVRRPAIEPYSLAQIRAMLQACDRASSWQTRGGRRAESRRPTALRDRAIILVLVDTGVRASELCELEIGDYHVDSGRIRVRHGKGDKERLVYAGEAARRAIWRYLLQRREARSHDPLFATASGRHLTRDNLLKLIKRVAERAQVGGANVHRFRHTFAIQYLRNGGSVLALQQALGHERMETVRIYAKLAASDLEEMQRSASPADRWRL